MDLENFFWRMEVLMKIIGKMVFNKEMEFTDYQMAIYMKVKLTNLDLMVMVKFPINTTFTKVILKIINFMEKAK